MVSIIVAHAVLTMNVREREWKLQVVEGKKSYFRHYIMEADGFGICLRSFEFCNLHFSRARWEFTV